MTMTKQERSDAHTWVDQRCTVCGVSQHSMGATMSGCAKHCPECQGTGTGGPDLGHQLPCDATGNDNDGMDWYCADGTRTYFGCPKCGTTDTGRFDGAMVCIDCLDQYDGDREQASLAEEADDRASWIEHVGPCVECGRPLDYDSKTDRYVHADDPTVGCRLYAGVA